MSVAPFLWSDSETGPRHQGPALEGTHCFEETSSHYSEKLRNTIQFTFTYTFPVTNVNAIMLLQIGTKLF